MEKQMKEEALKLADWLEDGEVEQYDINEAIDMIRKLVAELDKPMQIMPDGTMQPLYTAPQTSQLPDDYVFVCKKCGDEIGIKYEPQTKPLSDEEIKELWKLVSTFSNGDDDIIFARCIEERHGIK